MNIVCKPFKEFSFAATFIKNWQALRTLTFETKNDEVSSWFSQCLFSFAINIVTTGKRTSIKPLGIYFLLSPFQIEHLALKPLQEKLEDGTPRIWPKARPEYIQISFKSPKSDEVTKIIFN